METLSDATAIPLFRSSDNKADIVGLLCCVIKLYILFNPRQPETHKALSEWVHDPTFGGRTIEEGQIFAEMGNAVEICDEFGDRTIWGWLKARKRGDLPNEELGSAPGGGSDGSGGEGVRIQGVGMGYRYTALLSVSTSVLQRVTVYD